jgi:hypothetical protein
MGWWQPEVVTALTIPQIPSNIILYRVGPTLWIGTMILAWLSLGYLTIGMFTNAFIQEFRRYFSSVYQGQRPRPLYYHSLTSGVLCPFSIRCIRLEAVPNLGQAMRIWPNSGRVIHHHEVV